MFYVVPAKVEIQGERGSGFRLGGRNDMTYLIAGLINLPHDWGIEGVDYQFP